MGLSSAVMVESIKKNTPNLMRGKGETNKIMLKNKQDLNSKEVNTQIIKSKNLDNPLVNKTKMQSKIPKTKHQAKTLSGSQLPLNDSVSPNSVALISRFYQSELDLRNAKLPNRDVKILELLAKR